MIKKGSSYLSNPDITPQEKHIRHLRIIISDFDETDRALVVPITTWHEGNPRQDNSCILEQGEHSFIANGHFDKRLEVFAANTMTAVQELISHPFFSRDVRTDSMPVYFLSFFLFFIYFFVLCITLYSKLLKGAYS